MPTGSIDRGQLLYDLVGFCLVEDDEFIDTPEYVRATRYFDEFHANPEYATSSRNPDYNVARFLCLIGFHGWLRTAGDHSRTPAYEIFICSMPQMLETGHLVMTDACKLTDCQK